MASCPRLLRTFLLLLLLYLCALGNSTTATNRKNNQDRCTLKVSSGSDGSRKPVTFKTDNCSLSYPAGKYVIHEVMDVSFSHLSCEDQAAVVVHWAPSPLGIEHIKGFRVYLEDKNPERKQCQHLILKEPRQLNYSYKSTRLSSQTFSGLSFDTDYMIRVVPFPSLMNESFFPPSFLRTNSCEVLLGADSLVCKPFHSPWAGPIRAMAITVPLVIMSAFATLFTVMCRKKQQENIYSHLDEESSESSNQSAALISERPWPRPKVFLCYSNRDCPKHNSVVQAFAYFLQDFCGCEVVLDLWEHLDMCKEGQMSWLSRQLDEADFIITICSKGLRYFVERKSRRGKTPVGRRGNSSSSPAPKDGGPSGSGGWRASRFQGWRANRQQLKLMDQLPQLFSRLHSSHASLWDGAPPNVSRRNYFRSKSGRSVYVSICNMHQFISQTPDWFDQQLHGSHTGSPAHASLPVSCEASAAVTQSSLVLNEVAVKPLDSAPNRNVVLLAPGSGPSSVTSSSLSPSYSPDYDLGPRSSQSLPSASSRCSSSLSAPSSSSAVSSMNVPCVKTPPSVDQLRPVQIQDQGSGAEPSPPEPPPRDSGIYDSSVPSSELSIPLMDGLSHDHVDSSSLADSESSSSGLGDEEPPTVSSLHCGATTVCKAELHRQDAPVMSL
ncbi:hypothetical protein WMY93_020266 [Mugilogobius chulae]|uniref:SEFIR domain-containing protein n=1 Tax=Mugilogobius chulae TaxID=88201 RepID=A0AAW0NHQ6_9GOBI